ncbi:glutamate--cysteine ligase [Thalassotalea aquiviva]|uniref:glutamate--cysteine ligase n=1 Tax=Thalassotalea aquiviva TaxID=3242415 RepID=UPI00352AE205
MTISVSEFIQHFSAPERLSSLSGIKRGIERETLRIRPDGQLSPQSHNPELGSALTNSLITTDYSESLLEFITPASGSIEKSLNQLKDIQKFTMARVQGDQFWPMSMPCIVAKEDDIQLAQYGESNIGKMKTVYRQGLKNRYGSLMQVIAGIHFNFSFSPEFWQHLQLFCQDTQELQDFISERYFSLIRNYKRYGWLIPYLFGSSPALCTSFLQNKPHAFPFKKTPSGCLYLEYATSLRMSDLGYTNKAQSSLSICYNSLQSYINGVRNAINLPSEEFAKIGVKVDGKYQQLNSNVLQIENELYAPIRPKRVAKSGQKPSEALEQGGVEYIEVRAMDVNPFVNTGIDADQMRFLDVFLTYCVLAESGTFSKEQYGQFSKNTNDVVMQGRNPELKLNDLGTEKSIKTWGNELFSDFNQIAKLLDTAYGTTQYSEVIAKELEKINDIAKTPSAKIVQQLMQEDTSIISWSLELANKYKTQLEQHSYSEFSEQYLQQLATESIQQQQQIEHADSVSFDQFLVEYFAK